MIPWFDNPVCSGPKPKPGVWITPPEYKCAAPNVPPQVCRSGELGRSVSRSVGQSVGRCVRREGVLRSVSVACR